MEAADMVSCSADQLSRAMSDFVVRRRASSKEEEEDDDDREGKESQDVLVQLIWASTDTSDTMVYRHFSEPVESGIALITCKAMMDIHGFNQEFSIKEIEGNIFVWMRLQRPRTEKVYQVLIGFLPVDGKIPDVVGFANEIPSMQRPSVEE